VRISMPVLGVIEFCPKAAETLSLAIKGVNATPSAFQLLKVLRVDLRLFYLKEFL